MGGMVLETNMTEILTRIDEQSKLEKQEVNCCDKIFPLSFFFVGFFRILFIIHFCLTSSLFHL